ncbi:hypothetical protein C8Q72DRAFT_774739 [Fomitopsis betulina]|nr:hypothetical protein C8Q72DRAFT_774739 [Fomitopsis betulina]
MRTLRTVTLLIEDRRQSVGDEPVNMLVEVRVPIKEARRAEDGYLADAREVSEALQASPSRLDGRAKVFAFRGKYRQYFLRITPEDGIECNSSNLVVAPDQTLELFVEEVGTLLLKFLLVTADQRA